MGGEDHARWEVMACARVRVMERGGEGRVVSIDSDHPTTDGSANYRKARTVSQVNPRHRRRYSHVSQSCPCVPLKLLGRLEKGPRSGRSARTLGGLLVQRVKEQSGVIRDAVRTFGRPAERAGKNKEKVCQFEEKFLIRHVRNLFGGTHWSQKAQTR